ncbi:hypothetical protein [Pelomonas sp. SE-A7]|uniref:hypothetical protein n=1 Tax=Pelomonas sp. SE-A7 TaxID=3054953 RepID=UPI00259D0DB5|nr:hypothetical protein [Pelomonas sp. SE-A7]MDM4766607.1 hypothetical protein [Pelomonas sp. SE-A7]
MAKRSKTWAEKLETGEPHVEQLDRAFAGIPAGGRMLVSSPRELQAYLRRALRPGMTLDLPEVRARLARKHGADGTCPMSTSIFLRIVAEHAWDQLEAGTPIDRVTPFWRVVDPASPLALKLRAGPQWIAQQRAAEGSQ